MMLKHRLPGLRLATRMHKDCASPSVRSLAVSENAHYYLT